MKECIECGKKLGIIDSYRHPTMGKDYLLCSNCFDTVSISIEKWREANSSYVGFFTKETSTIDDIQKIAENITKNSKKRQNTVSKLWLHKTNQKANENLSIIN